MRCQCGQIGCNQEATVKIWCPTWLDANRGPIYRSAPHARVFTDNAEGAFYYGDEADQKFRLVEAFIPVTDERFRNVLGMLKNGQHVAGNQLGKRAELSSSMFHESLHIVDGKLWLVTSYLASRLGDHVEAKAAFAKLVEQVQRRERKVHATV